MLKLGLITGLLIVVLVFIGGCLPAQPAPDSGNNSTLLLIGFLVLIFGFFYFTMVRPQRKKQKQQQQMIRELQKGDKVMTSGGIYGTIESLNEESIVIKVESGATLRVDRRGILGRRGETQR